MPCGISRSGLLVVIVLCLPLGCRRIEDLHQPPTLTVFAAASLTGVFRELADTVRYRYPGLAVDLSFGDSQVLAFQIKHGAAADLFASADDQYMRTIEDTGMVNGTPQVFAYNRLTIIIPPGKTGHVTRLEDLSRKGIKLVVEAEAAPAGRHARQVIANLAGTPGFPTGYERRTLANVVSNEETVKGVVTKVQLGEADAGLVYVSDVSGRLAATVRRIDIPEAQNVVARYPVAVLRHARNADAAHEFVGLLLSPTGRRILQAYGFTVH